MSVFDNSLFYADGLFETFLAVKDRIVFMEDHLNRLEKGAKLINIKIPVDRKTIIRWLNSANKKNNSEIKKIRLTVTSGDSAFWAGRSSLPRIIIIVTEYSLPRNNFRLTVSPYRIDQGSPFRNVKTLSFVVEMTSRKNAYAGKFDDAILLTRNGYVAETTSANLFWVKNGVLYTTPCRSGCLEGMTRKHIIELAYKNDVPFREKMVRLSEVLKADEIFVTSSIKLIIPVSSVTYKMVYRYRTGKLAMILRSRLKSQIFKEG